MSLDIGLPVKSLRDVIHDCSNGRKGSEEIILDAVNRRRRPFRCRVVCSPLHNGDRGIEGVVLTMETATS
jgi:two-component system, chemotaxis family, CheB/CheR fusion protein